MWYDSYLEVKPIIVRVCRAVDGGFAVFCEASERRQARAPCDLIRVNACVSFFVLLACSGY